MSASPGGHNYEKDSHRTHEGAADQGPLVASVLSPTGFSLSRPPLTRKPSNPGSSHGAGPVAAPHTSTFNATANRGAPAHSHAALSAAAAASTSRRPVLKVVPPVSFDAGSSQGSVPMPAYVASPPSQSAGVTPVTAYAHEPSSATHPEPLSGTTDASNSASSHSHTASASSVSSVSSAPQPRAEPIQRRLWFRKKSGGSATSLIVTSSELVDDVKIRILQKYPTSLQLKCDPADLAMTVSQSSRIRLELQPDEDIIEVMDRFFPNGMKMNDALEVGPSVSMWAPGSAASSGNRIVTPRLGLQRTRSYSNTQSHAEPPPQLPQTTFPSNPNMYGSSGTLTPAAMNTGAITPGGSINPHQHLLHLHAGNQGKPITPTQENMPPLVPSELGPVRSSPNDHTQRSSVSSASSTAQSPLNATPTNGSALSTPSGSTANMHTIVDGSGHRNSTSVLLLPKQLGAAKSSSSESKSSDPHSTKLVPVTAKSNNNEKSDDENGSTTSLSSMFGSTGYFSDNHPGGVTDVTLGRPRSTTQSLSNGTPSGFLLLQQQLSPSTIGKASVVPMIKVLIVEDNPVNLSILEVFMKRKKVRFGLANNGREALDKWKAGGYHLILMDIQLPVMTGLEVTKEIRRLEILNGIGAFPQAYKDGQPQLAAPAPHEVIKKSKGGFRSPVIIVALTASSDTDDKSEALAAGCNDFLTKPVNFMWLEKKIAEWGCMQALIDYDGWKKWSDETNDKDSSKFGSASSSGKHSRRSSGHQITPAPDHPPLPKDDGRAIATVDV